MANVTVHPVIVVRKWTEKPAGNCPRAKLKWTASSGGIIFLTLRKPICPHDELSDRPATSLQHPKKRGDVRRETGEIARPVQFHFVRKAYSRNQSGKDVFYRLTSTV